MAWLKRRSISIAAKLRNYFITGMVVLVPIGVTFYLIKFFMSVSPKLIPKNINPKDVVWRSKIHHYDDTVRSDDTRMIITNTGKGKDKFQMWAVSDKSGDVVFHFGDKPTLDDAKEFASIRKWQEKKWNHLNHI